jgi:ankyrin repeat protein
MMRVLAEAGADARLTTNDGMTPLLAAAGVSRVLAETRVTVERSADAVALACELGCDVDHANKAGDTALHGAALIRADAIIRFLAGRGATLSVANRRGETPLMIAERTVAAGSAPVVVRTSTGDLLRSLGAGAPSTEATAR